MTTRISRYASLFLMLFTAAAQAEVATVRWGPITVDAMSSTENLILTDVAKPCKDCYITGVKIDLLHEDGSVANYSTMAMLHHMVVANNRGTDATCGSTVAMLGERFFAAGNERTTADLPTGYGYFVSRKSEWNAVVDIMNMADSQKDFYLEASVTYEPKNAALTAVKPIWLDLDNCSDSEISLPAGYSDTHWDWASDRDYLLVAGSGHTHDGGISIAAENITRGGYVCTSVAGYLEGSSHAPAPVTAGDEGHPGSANEISALDSDPGYMGHIEDHSLCPGGATLYAGDILRLHTQYNLPAADDGAMGIMVLYAAPL